MADKKIQPAKPEDTKLEADGDQATTRVTKRSMFKRTMKRVAKKNVVR